MNQSDKQYLQNAKTLLEKPGLTARVSSYVGTPVEKGLKFLPQKIQGLVHKASEKSIQMALDIALSTIDANAKHKTSENLKHKMIVAGTGGIGGLLGPTTLMLELPVSTTVMMRSILDIARSEGEDLKTPEAQLACLEVFAFGGRAVNDDGAGSGYFMTRAALSKAFTDATRVLAGRAMSEEGASIVSRFVMGIASRFQFVVSEKVAAQLVPVLGAVGGAGLNVLFMDHFQDMARGHFVIRRLERKYGAAQVQEVYEQISL